MDKVKLSRRQLLQTSALAGGGLILSYYIPQTFKGAFAEEAAKAPVAPVVPNAFVQIAPDNSVTIVINKLEMGQGVNTSMAQLIAEELECDWTKIRSVSAPVNPVFNHTVFGTQMTGGSSALISSWDQHRRIGAAMREMLTQAAAERWGVPVTEVKAANGELTHAKKGKLTYGAVADAAAKLQVPAAPKLKAPKDFKIIGKSMKRVDAMEKSNGKAVFGLDVRIPGMVYAAVARPPIPGAKLGTIDTAAAKKVPGVLDVVKFSDRVAVLAKNSFAARSGRDLLNAKWSDAKNGKLNTTELMNSYREAAKGKGVVAQNKGDVMAASAKAAQTLTGEYEFPYLAHACMEPMNCTINYDGKTAEIWSGHQMPTIDREVAAKTLGLAADKVTVHTTYAGGSFGRRASKLSDYVVEAAELAKVVKKPLKVVWSREDDMRGGFYRPMNYHNVKISLDAKKKFLAWDHVTVGQSVIAGSMFEKMLVKDGLESTQLEGISDSPYALENFRFQATRMISPVPTLWWRSVGHTHTAYVMETMIDELAEATGEDALKMRLRLLKNSPRHMAVLKLLSKESPWGKGKPPKGRAWGLAIHESFNSVVGEIAEVSMQDGMPRVHKIWAAVDCGQVVNPEGARAQVEGGIVYGLSAAFHQQVEFKDGQAVQSNFHDYPVMRITDMPDVKVFFVKSDGTPTGLGEPGVPPAAPAVANAVYKLTQKRLRKLPFTRELKA